MIFKTDNGNLVDNENTRRQDKMANRRRQEPLASGKHSIAATQACIYDRHACVSTVRLTKEVHLMVRQVRSSPQVTLDRHLFHADLCRVTFIVT